MRLYSANLHIKDTLTKEKFLSLVIEWNKSIPYEENRINTIEWNGEDNIRFSDESKWLEFCSYPEKDIVAVRFEKVVENNIIWDTDYIMNFAEHRMVILLDRSYQEDAVETDEVFSSPYFIKLLIQQDYLEPDYDLPVGLEPVVIGGDSLTKLAHVVAPNNKYQYPVVFVSKTKENKDPLDVKMLAHQLKGAAHVFVQEEHQSNKDLRVICNERNDYNGAVGIYFPNGKQDHKRIYIAQGQNQEERLTKEIIRYVFHYGNLQKLDPLYTWQGVNNALLNESLKEKIQKLNKAELAERQAKNEVDEVYQSLEEELTGLQQKIADLTRQNEALAYENQSLHNKAAQMKNEPILFRGAESDLYPFEIKELLLSVLEESLSNTKEKTRRYDVLKDIIDENHYEHRADEINKSLKSIFKGYKTLSAAMKNKAEELGLVFSEDGKHYKITLKGDQRYMATLPKTPSDNRSGDNVVAIIRREMF